MRYRAFAIDLDGTLLDGEQVPQANVDMLKRARDAGVRVFIATARWKEKALDVQALLGISEPLIACSGAQVFDPVSGQDLFDARLPEAFTAELYEICNAERCIATITTTSQVQLKLEGQPSASLMGAEMQWVPELALESANLPRIAAIQGSSAVNRIKSELQRKYAAEVNLFDSIGPTGRLVITLTANRADKGQALSALCEDIRLDPAQVVAFGDAENDLAMFRVAGAAVAMGQADEAVKAAADFNSLPNDKAGVAHAVQHLLTHGDFVVAE